MGLAMERKKGPPLPVLTCDKCGGQITDWRLAIITYRWVSEDSITGVKVYHKGQCDPGKLRDGSVLWEELRNYLAWLLWHHNWGLKQTTEKGSTITLNVPKPLDV